MSDSASVELILLNSTAHFSIQLLLILEIAVISLCLKVTQRIWPLSLMFSLIDDDDIATILATHIH